MFLLSVYEGDVKIGDRADKLFICFDENNVANLILHRHWRSVGFGDLESEHPVLKRKLRDLVGVGYARRVQKNRNK